MRQKKRSWTSTFAAALRGIGEAIKEERNMRVHVAAAAGVAVYIAVTRPEKVELFFLLLAIFLVLITEMINTALERTVDLATDEYRELARQAKDAAAGAVLLAAVFAVLVGIITVFF
ncbi:MAG: undecaprenol kinase [Eubacteriales bacterium]|nr:undecaprenol kinase [Eubacteriales bacterium]